MYRKSKYSKLYFHPVCWGERSSVLFYKSAQRIFQLATTQSYFRWTDRPYFIIRLNDFMVLFPAATVAQVLKFNLTLKADQEGKLNIFGITIIITVLGAKP